MQNISCLLFPSTDSKSLHGHVIPKHQSSKEIHTIHISDLDILVALVVKIEPENLSGWDLGVVFPTPDT